MPRVNAVPEPGTHRGRSMLLPAPADILFILFLAALPLARGWQAINTDGDLGRHLRVGSDILAEGLFFTDRYSWTMQGQPFVPYEWLSEVLFALSHRWAGFNGVLALCALLVATTIWLLMLWFRRMGVEPLLAFVASAAAGLAGSFHWLARPHLWSLPGTVLVLLLMTAATGPADPTSPESSQTSRLPSRRLMLLTVALFAVWANLHGGFLFGLVLLALLALGEALDWWIHDRQRSPSRLQAILAILGAAVLGSCINPVGPSLFGHMFATLGNSWVLSMTMEYRSPNFHLWWGRVFLVLLLTCIAAMAGMRRTMPLRVLLPFMATAAFALHSARNIPLWALSGFPLLVAHADPDWRGLRNELLSRFRSSFETAARAAVVGLWSAAAALAALGLVRVAPPHPGFDPGVFPVEAVARARAQNITGRIFNEMGWGGYILYAWRQQEVFIDAQTDFYGERLSMQYASVRAAEPGWEERLDSLEVEVILMPPEAPLALALAAAPGWYATDSSSGALRFQRTDEHSH